MPQKDQGLDSNTLRYQVIPRVLLFVRNGEDVLLLKGASSKRLWPNLYNGIGGHLERGEIATTAARRELFEEAGLEVAELELKAIIHVDGGQTKVGVMMFVFTAWSSERKTRPSAEGELHWLPATEIDHINVVEDLSWLLPRVLHSPKGATPLFASYSYDSGDNLVISTQIA